jgi:hypothetical protein
LKVLIDYDHPQINRGWAWRRGRQLITYALRRKLGLEASNDETDDYLQTLIRLNKLCGIETAVGLRDVVEIEKPELRGMLEDSGVEVHSHIHLGENSDPNRQRKWNPPLNQSRATWHYDQDYVAGIHPRLRPGELPCFHADYPYLLSHYIKFLYEWKILGVNPYDI